jgi:anaerobic magnesium-protoporphyrin IX monomethyl ester cyclase
MRLLLINPEQSTDLSPFHPPSVTKVSGTFPPIGLAYVATVVKSLNHIVSIFDLQMADKSIKSLLDEIRMQSPEIIGMGSMTFTFKNAVKIAKIVKEWFPKKPIIFGGPQTSAFPVESLQQACFDIGVYGEGEDTIGEILTHYSKYGSLPVDLKGTISKNNGNIKVNPSRDWIKDLDKIPFPARDLLQNADYEPVFAKKPFTTMITSRGCPYRCTFCALGYFGNTIRARSASNVVDEMEICIRDFGIKDIMVYDDTFGVNKKRVLDICREKVNRGLNVSWNVRTRVDRVDEEILFALKKSGCDKIHMGIESASQEILKKMKKDITIEQIKKAFQAAKKVGIDTVGYFMIGYPGDTLKTIDETIKFSTKLGLSWADFSITTPAPLTELNKIAVEGGYLEKDYWKKYIQGEKVKHLPYYTTAEFDEEKLQKLINKAYRHFYLRPSFIFKRLISTDSLHSLINSIKGLFSLLKVATLILF